jgi:hypothetical protein
VSLEYRLDDTANKYVTLFFQNNAYDWLDGYTQEYGGGFIWRRSLQHFKDIFNLRADDKAPQKGPLGPMNPLDHPGDTNHPEPAVQPESADSTTTENNRK